MRNDILADWTHVANLNKGLAEIGAGREPSVQQLGGFTRAYSHDEVVRRLKRLREWLLAVNASPRSRGTTPLQGKSRTAPTSKVASTSS